MLKKLGGIQHVLHLSTRNTNNRIATRSGTSGISAKRSKEAHHVRIVLIHTHVRERIETGHSSEPQMTVQLGERVVWVLPGLHLWQGLGRSGSRR